MTTLNYWLGKLQRMQLFGHGVHELRVMDSDGQKFLVTEVKVQDGEVVIKIDTREV